MIAIYHQIQTPIGSWCKRELKLKSFIQLSEMLIRTQ